MELWLEKQLLPLLPIHLQECYLQLEWIHNSTKKPQFHHKLRAINECTSILYLKLNGQDIDLRISFVNYPEIKRGTRYTHLPWPTLPAWWPKHRIFLPVYSRMDFLAARPQDIDKELWGPKARLVIWNRLHSTMKAHFLTHWDETSKAPLNGTRGRLPI